MSAKIIQIPEKTIDVNSPSGAREKKNIFVQLLTNVLELTPQKSDTETFLAHSLREKIDCINGASTFEMEESEIHFIQSGIQKLRERESLAGSDWYFLINPLRSAEDKKVFERKKKKQAPESGGQ